MRWIFLLFVILPTVVCQWDRYYYYNPYYQYYGRLPPRNNIRQRTTPRHRTVQNIQRDQPQKRLSGPNVCTIREVFGTGQRFYEEFTEELPQQICNRKTFQRRTCCTGYSKTPNEDGCTSMTPLRNVLETARKHRLLAFLSYLKNTELGDELKSKGSFTAFIPTEKAFRNLTHGDRQRLYPWTYNAPTILHYHVIYGRQNYTSFTNERKVPTLYYGHKYVRLNKYQFGINTVNCAMITRPNVVASNGLIHIIDRVIKPLDSYGDLANLIAMDPRFTQFTRILYAAKMVDELQTDGDFTVFVPDNRALKYISPSLKDKIFKEKSVAEAIVKFHIAKGVYCGAASVRALKLQTLNGGTIQYQCRYNGKYVEHAKVVTEDIIAKNGVVHIINKPLIPNIVKTVIELSRDLKLKTFVDMVHRGGFNQYLENRKGFTLFAPSDDAFKGLPTTYLQTLQSQPGLIDKMLKYHTVQNKAFSDSFIGGKILPTSMEGTHIKIHTYRTKMTINDAEIQSSDKECSNAVIHIINKVLIPPEHTLLDLLSLQGDLSDFKKAVEMVNVTDVLSDEQKQLTVIAPTNSAMRKVDKKIYDDKKLLKKFILRHVIEGVVVSAGLTPGITYTVPSIQSERVSFKLEPSNDILWINKDSKAISKDRIAKNGYLFKLDQVLHCKCNKRK